MIYYISKDILFAVLCSESSAMCEKLEIGLWDQKIFQGKRFFIKNFDFNKRCKNEIEDNNENKWSRFSDTVSQKIDFTVWDLHRDHPPAWNLN